MDFKVEYPSFCAMAKKDYNLYFSDSYTNSLFMLDMRNEKIKYISDFPDETKDELIHCRAFVIDTVIVFVPDQGNYIHIVDINSTNVFSVKLNKVKDSRYAINDCVLVDGVIWIFPGDGINEIISFDTKTMCLRRHGVVNKELCNKGESVYFYKLACKNRIVYMVEYGTSFIVAYDIDGKNSKIIDTGVNNLMTIDIVNNTIWITSSDGVVYRYDENKNNFMAYDIEDGESSGSWLVFSVLDCIMLVSEQGGYVYKLDESFNKFVIMKELYIEPTDSTCKGEIYQIYKHGSEIIFSVPRGINCLQRIVDCKIQKMNFKFSNCDVYKNIRIKSFQKKIKSGMVLKENSDLNLSSYIELIDNNGI